MENGPSDKQMGVGSTILIGHLIVTLPIVVFVCGLTLLGILFTGYTPSVNPKWIYGFLFLGFVMAWSWWSLLTPKWRSWAHKKGVSPGELQKWAVRTGLVWPKGWIFEKTEYKWTDDKQ